MTALTLGEASHPAGDQGYLVLHDDAGSTTVADVLEVRTVIVCMERRISWGVDDEPQCSDPDHEHREWEVHRQLTEVELPDASQITAVSFHEADPYGREAIPEFGLYLDHRWEPPWSHAHVDWPDFGVPADDAALRVALDDLLVRARAGQRVEMGCLGGHGRTGTALACLAVLVHASPASKRHCFSRHSPSDGAIQPGFQNWRSR